MRRSFVLAAVASLAGAIAIAGYSVSALSADHQDAPGSTAAPTADINDVFTWMDGNNVVLAMTVYPDAPTTATFDNTVQYVFHTQSVPTTAFIPLLSTNDAGALNNNVDVIATFDTNSPQNIQLWVGKSEYVTGNPNNPNGLASMDGKVKVYAGLRADPFFFNLTGFKTTVGYVESQAGSLTFNEAGCPALVSGQEDIILGDLSTTDGGAPQNFFGTFNALTLVVAVDKSLLTSAGTNVAVWGSTYSTATSGDAGGQ
jgi:hypothetical protein